MGLTLRNEVAGVLLPTLQRDHKCGLHAGPGSGVCRSCRRRAGLCADALLPLLARVREEGEARVRERVEAAMLAAADELDEWDGDAVSSLGGVSPGGLIRHDIRAALAEGDA